jgi:hypothetical protein
LVILSITVSIKIIVMPMYDYLIFSITFLKFNVRNASFLEQCNAITPVISNFFKADLDKFASLKLRDRLEF